MQINVSPKENKVQEFPSSRALYSVDLCAGMRPRRIKACWFGKAELVNKGIYQPCRVVGFHLAVECAEGCLIAVSSLPCLRPKSISAIKELLSGTRQYKSVQWQFLQPDVSRRIVLIIL
jgi:hypothetical protein